MTDRPRRRISSELRPYIDKPDAEAGDEPAARLADRWGKARRAL